MSTRFISEFGLAMGSEYMVLLQEEHLSNLRELLPNVPPTHIYIIGSRPRVILVPTKFRFEQDYIHGAFAVQLKGQLEEIEVTFRQLTPRIDQVESVWPHTMFAFYAASERVLHGKVALLASRFAALHEFNDLEVLYVGQSYGTAGERQAADRLQSHSTLQKILGEASRLHPDREIWLALIEFKDTLLASFDGRLGPEAEELDEGRIERVLTNEVSDAQKINFTEAALIRYFEPKYNSTFRNSFPSPAHASYTDCYEIDLNLVAVGLNTMPLGFRLYSDARPREWFHMITFPLHDSAERRSMLDLLMPDADASSKHQSKPTHEAESAADPPDSWI